ncbi:hypothetical protein SAMN05660226_01931 [Parapedobacter luteus]|uniref:Gfo/Idh/MocA-like oxidoreductase C-terminal domain-containing protein n=1 Tax=Parapedobacter luteus TaxID=623280 RepID=A0A1T5C7G7_9SPHI|nr:hypothetical protein [Parapedobacter luteus]SKB55347.1 hypothetical protein SAMN05660226_01931 [Parapedobacter luteus]
MARTFRFMPIDGSTLVRYSSPGSQTNIPVKNGYFRDHLAYLEAVLSGTMDTENDLSSLANNLIVVEILHAARESAKRGERIVL